jgi:hypothetical protein
MEYLSFQYPAWYLLLCVLLGLGYASLLYVRSNSFRERGPWLNWVLGTLRFLTVTIISMLLLAPLLRSTQLESQAPVVVLLQDQSESVTQGMDSIAFNNYRREFEALQTALAGKAELQSYAFSTDIRPGIDWDMSGKSTNIGLAFREIYNLYSNQNLAAVILATDGIYNEGSNPLYQTGKLNAPVFTIGLGDTIPRKDLILRRVFHNKIAYLGDKFSVQYDIAAVNCAGSNGMASVYKVDGNSTKLLQQFPFTINRDDYFETREILLDADQPGVQRFRIVLSSLPGEATTANNAQDFFVDVLDARQKILILANAPHPDISAIRQALDRSRNYEVSVGYIKDLRADPAQYDFVILHQLPSITSDISNILRDLDQRNISRLFVLGAQTQVARFNAAQPLLNLQGDGRSLNEVNGLWNPGFNLFVPDEKLREQVQRFPPILAPFGEYQLTGNAQVLLKQRIGRVDTEYPLLLLGEDRDIKIGIFCAEGIWRWRLFDYLERNNHDLVDDLIRKTVQYLSVKADKRRFRVVQSKSIFKDNEPILFDAELYNQSFELINEPDVTLSITDEEDRSFQFTFNRSTKAYTLNAGLFPAGSYRYTARTTPAAGQELRFEGQFSIEPVQLERFETTANHTLLRLLSAEYGGQFLLPGELGRLPELLEAQSSLKPVLYERTQTRSLIHLKWIFGILLLLLATEWFLRRYFGGY